MHELIALIASYVHRHLHFYDRMWVLMSNRMESKAITINKNAISTRISFPLAIHFFPEPETAQVNLRLRVAVNELPMLSSWCYNFFSLRVLKNRQQTKKNTLPRPVSNQSDPRCIGKRKENRKRIRKLFNFKDGFFIVATEFKFSVNVHRPNVLCNFWPFYHQDHGKRFDNAIGKLETLRTTVAVEMSVVRECQLDQKSRRK